MRKLMAAALCVALLTSLAACRSTQPAMSDKPMTGTYDEPQWVSKGVTSIPEDTGKAIYGVGVADRARFPDLYLRRKAAEERGRAAVAAQIRTMVASVFKDYVEAAFTPGMDKAEERSLTSNVQKSVVDETLVGAEVRDRWTHPATGNEYALVRLSLDSTAAQVRSRIIDVEKGKLRVDAEKAHKELDEIIDKARQDVNK